MEHIFTSIPPRNRRKKGTSMITLMSKLAYEKIIVKSTNQNEAY